MISNFNSSTAAIQGSGWGWLAYNKQNQMIEFHATANQDTLIEKGSHLVPLLTIDIWEHAYYLDYQNARPKFLNEMWRIVNWSKINDRFMAASKMEGKM